METIKNVSISKLHSFRNHPFKVETNIIDDKAFQSCSVQNVVIGRGNVELGDNAFSYCEDLVSVEIKGVLSDIMYSMIARLDWLLAIMVEIITRSFLYTLKSKRN